MAGLSAGLMQTFPPFLPYFSFLPTFLLYSCRSSCSPVRPPPRPASSVPRPTHPLQKHTPYSLGAALIYPLGEFYHPDSTFHGVSLLEWCEMCPLTRFCDEPLALSSECRSGESRISRMFLKLSYRWDMIYRHLADSHVCRRVSRSLIGSGSGGVYGVRKSGLLAKLRT